MRKYEVIEYEREDYDNYEKNLTQEELINNLEHINRGYIGDYNYTGEVDDFNRFKLHMSLYKVIELLENGELKLSK